MHVRLACLLMVAGTAQATPADVVFSFSGPDGAHPAGALVADAAGALYGLAQGGTQNNGVAFRYVPGGGETVLYDFPAPFGSTGPGPIAIGPDGTLYGTTLQGGAHGAGSVFSLTAPAGGSGNWTYAELYDFTGGADGANPASGVTVGPDGALYVPTRAYPGTILRLSHGAQGWSAATIFAGIAGDPSPVPDVYASPLAFGADGAIYGVAAQAPNQTGNEAAVFRLAQGGGGWTMTSLAAGPFAGSVVPFLPAAIFAQSVDQPGAIFELTPPAGGGGAWSVTALAYFTGLNGSGLNVGMTLRRQDGGALLDLLGTTLAGGGAGAAGLVFTLSGPLAGAWRQNEPHIFRRHTGDGLSPTGALTRVTTGAPPYAAWYGLTAAGGAHNLGTIYRLK